jgi:hypothetical protein
LGGKAHDMPNCMDRFRTVLSLKNMRPEVFRSPSVLPSVKLECDAQLAICARNREVAIVRAPGEAARKFSRGKNHEFAGI